MSRIGSAGLASFVVLLGVAALARADESIPKVTHDGLHLMEDTKLARVWMMPGASLSAYERVKILDCFVAFEKNWQRGRDLSTRITSRQMDRIKTELAALFREVFIEELERGDGYQVVDETGEDVLLLRPAIIDLDITAPDPVGQNRVQTFGFSAGSMTLVAELYDSLTSDIIARAIDAEGGQGSGVITWQDGVSNRAQARRILRGWAARLRAALDEAHGR